VIGSACRSPIERAPEEKPLVTVLNATGTPATATVRFRVWGFHPMLRVIVSVFYQRATGGANDSTSTWDARAILRDASGRRVNLQTIYTGRSLEDGHEVSSGAEAIEYTCAIGSMTTSNGQGGTWMARLNAYPEHPMDAELFTQLASRLNLDVDKVVPQINRSVT
jgi:hypothetical protein